MALQFTIEDIKAADDKTLRWFAQHPSYKKLSVREIQRRADIRKANAEREKAEREARKATLCFDFIASGNVIVNGKPMSYDKAWLLAHGTLSLTGKNQWNNTERFPEIALVQRGAKKALAELSASFKFNNLVWSNAKNPARIVIERILLGLSLDGVQPEVEAQIALDIASRKSDDSEDLDDLIGLDEDTEE